MADGNGRVQRMIFQLVLFRRAPETSLETNEEQED